MRPDLKVHFIGGLIVLLVFLATLYAGSLVPGYGATFQMLGLELGYGIEFYQRYRKSGTFSHSDALVTAAPWIYFGGVLEAVRYFL